jgi:hypothetical protein
VLAFGLLKAQYRETNALKLFEALSKFLAHKIAKPSSKCPIQYMQIEENEIVLKNVSNLFISASRFTICSTAGQYDILESSASLGFEKKNIVLYIFITPAKSSVAEQNPQLNLISFGPRTLLVMDFAWGLHTSPRINSNQKKNLPT